MSSEKPFTIEQALTILAQTPQRIAALTADLTPAQLRTPPAPGEWSANDVLAHLRSCADIWGGCIRRLLAVNVHDYFPVSCSSEFSSCASVAITTVWSGKVEA